MHSRLVRSGPGGFLVGLLVSGAIPWSGRSWAATQLPVPCFAGSCGTNASSFVTTGAATAVQSGKTLSVNQTSNTATLNWSSFNISADGKVVFKQPSATSIALNKIFDTNPSSIFGTLTSNGQIYLINANGFLFGPGATVNVGGLLASSLNLTDANFAAGILAPGIKGQSALQPFVDSAGNVISQSITVDAGATLTAADQGRLLLAAPNVSNAGSLNAPDGQIILAAGQSLYLQASNDSNLRGLIVEVDGGGTAANQLSGAMSAPRGNVTLTGLMVNQDGRVSATTSVAANGSVILQAADTFPTNYSLGSAFSATRGGTVVLGPGSVTEVLPELSDTATAVAAQTQLQSSITITGQQVFMNDAVIDAPSGQLNVTAAANPSQGVQSTDNPNAQIRIDASTSINLAGSQAQLPMDANLLTVQLRSNELADDPTQKGGALQSTPTNTVTVTVDMRADNGAGSPIADLQSAIAAVGQNIAQRTEMGGTAAFESEGDVILNPGASINVSGGATTYQGGTIQTSYLIGANGQLYNIGSANPLLTYKSVVNPTFTQSYDKWGIQEVIPTPGLSQYQSSYVQGAAAGSIQFAAPSLLLAGSLQGSAVSGPYQRSAPPQGGTLIIGAPALGLVSTNNQQIDYLAPSVVFANSLTPIVVANGTPLPVQTLQLPTSYVTSDGFADTQIFSNTSVALPAGLPLQLTPGASLSLVAPRIDVDSSIASLDGTLLFENVLSSASPAPSYTPGLGLIRPGVEIGSGVTLNVSGEWTNDAIWASGVGTSPTYLNGGKIALALTTPGSELVLGDNVSLIANGGAWLQSGGTVSYGAGGAVTLDASPSTAAIHFGEDTRVEGFGAGTAKGGTFTLYATRIDVSEGNGTSWTQAQTVDDLDSTTGPVLDLYAPLFANYGFSSINLTATGAAAGVSGDVLTVASGTSISAQTSTLQLDNNYTTIPTGGTLSAISAPTLLPPYERPAASVALNVIRETDDAVALGNANYGQLDVQTGSSIVVDPGGSIALTGEGGVNIGGTLRAPGGAIAVFIPSPGDVNSNTAPVTDPGYVPTLGIDIASTAVLDVGGITVMQPNSQGLLTGTMLPGGSVSLIADRGTITTEAGSTIDFAGTSALLDVTNGASVGATTREVLASAGGSLTVSAGESVSLLGNFNGAAGASSSGTAASGSLIVDMTRTLNSGVQGPGQPLPSAPLEIELVGSTTGASPSPAYADVAILGAQQIGNSGIDALSLQADGNVYIDASLSLARQLSINSPAIGTPITATLSAPFVELGNSATAGAPAVVPTPFGGNGNLIVSAQQMVLQGNFAVQGTSQVTLSSTGDVQLQGTSPSGATGPTTGSLVTNGSLAIDALRVYPDTYTAFTITSLPGNGATVSIGGSGASPGSPLSADGAVSVSADNVTVTGTLLAPFGSINLIANDALTLAKGSLVSVSGAGLTVPFGQTQLNQGEWVYDAPNGTLTTITGVPTKLISLAAPNVVVQSGATANIQGGGELYAYEWVPGTGGSYDNLNAVCCASAGNVALSSYPNLYAILPSERGQAGPYDPQESGSAVPGQTIYLSGGAGIAAGYYALLPPRYALEPGAVLIQLDPGITSASGGQLGTLANGTPVIGGFLSVGTTGLNTAALARYEGVAVYPTGYAQELANYTISNASSYFAAQAAAAGTGLVAEPADAGTFTLSVTPSTSNFLSLEGSVLTAAATGGRGAQINLSAPDLEITGPNGAIIAGAITVSGGVLQSWNASSMTLGGVSTTLPASSSTSSTSTGATNASAVPSVDIAVAANNVTVDSGVQLVADQIELVALQSIDVETGASLMSTSGKSGTVLKTLPAQQTVYLTSEPYSTVTDAAANELSPPALLSISDLALSVASRSALNGAVGATIDVARGATLASAGALAIDAPGDVTLAGTLSGKGASWSLSSGSVAFVASAPSNDSLNINTALLSSLQQAGALRISSEGNIDIDAPVSLGVGASAPTLSSLTLIGNAINNNAAGNSEFGAASLNISGNITPTSASAAPAAATAGAGSLLFDANTLVVGPGVLSVNGFAQTTAQVAGAFEGTSASYLNVGGNLTINAAELTAAPVATDLTSIQGVTSAPGTTLAATGTLAIGAPTSLATGTTLPTLVGGSLTLSAADIEDAGAILAPSGVVELNSSGNLHLASTASISTAGTALQAVNQTAYSPGGLVQLTATGNMSLDAGSSVSVAGSAKAPAGTLSLDDQGGTLTVAGTIDGAAPSGNTGGSLIVDAVTLSSGLASLVANPGLSGFNQAVNVRVQNGDLDLASGGAITANNITLTADSGAIGIAGVLSAPSAAQRGLIDLSGGAGVTLGSTGQLHADGSGSAGRGGEIDLNSVVSSCNGTTCTSTGSITLMNGSIITADGAAQMGELVLRAPALTATNDVAINAGQSGIGADVSTAGQVIIEPVMVTPTSSATISSDLGNAASAAAGFLTTAAPTIAARLSIPSATPIAVQAGIELQDANPNDALALPALDLSQYSTSGQVINVAVRAAGSITIDGTISDGFTTGSAGGGPSTVLTNLPSGSLTFVAGADLSSANPVSVLANSAAALTLGPSAIVRTGTGDIDLSAAGDVMFQSGLSGGATVYTGGLAGAAAVTMGSGRRLGNFATDGGNVTVTAGDAVVGAPFVDLNLNGGNFSVTGWQPRGLVTPATSGQAAGPAQYGVNFDEFDWNVGALGGGDVTVLAGGSVNNLSAATADSSPDGNATIYGAGGGLRVTAVGDIGSTQVYVADGTGTITTNAGLPAIVPGSTPGSYLGSTFTLGNSNISVWARQTLQVDAVYDPTYIAQSAQSSGQPVNFFTYGSNSSLNLSSTDGSATLELIPDKFDMGVLLGPALLNSTAGLLNLPANLSMQALQQDVDLKIAGTGAILFPSDTGQLSLFAGQDIVGNGSTLAMADSFPSAVWTASSPQTTAPASAAYSIGGLVEFQGAIHVGDPNPALITAAEDIDDLGLNIPKAADVAAGRDIVNLVYVGQNVVPSDTTLITAGRDIVYTANSNGIAVGGPGSLDIFAGRNLNLGVSGGITTTGNLENANLPGAEGADVTLAVGYGSQGADYFSFLKNIIAPSTTYQDELIEYVETQTGNSALSFAQAQTVFTSFSQSRQAPLIDKIFFNELLLSGRAANSRSGVGFTEGYAAIAALYPGSSSAASAAANPYAGDLNLTTSQIYTLSGGNISILVPGGDIDVGLAYTPAGLIQKPASELGIVAEGAGNVDIYAQGNVNVNASRIFTLGGGNILIWSDEGSIDAGNGSKSSLSVPPPVILISNTGSISLDYGASLAAGSGIRTIQTNPSVPPGDVDLDAPVGTVNAGDAGIGASGNINIAAAHVIGALNINFGGTASGVPSDLSGLAASLSGVSSVATSATTSGAASAESAAAAAKEVAPLAQTALSWLEVFVTGLGEENCKQDDVECLKRQKSAAP
ncbi:MAG: filamentous hemagglutinin family protein [Steroidobacteraceae bacterium]